MSFLNFCCERGLILDNLIQGRWVRVPTVDHPHKRNGAYWYGGDFGHIQNWATMDSCESWRDSKPRTPAQQQDMEKRITESKRKYDTDKKAAQKRAADKAAWILKQTRISKHSYLERKGFKDMTGNVWMRDEKPLLVVPMNYQGSLVGCQLISNDGSKKFLTGQQTSGASFTIGQGEQHFICEGFATGLSLQTILVKALKMPSAIHVSFSAGNAVKLAKRLPNAIFIADNDVSKAGEKAAIESGLKWWMPPVEGWDANDYLLSKGLFRAAQELRGAIYG